MATEPNRKGYLTVRVTVNGIERKYPVHSLVCEAFHGSRPSKTHQTRHLNGINTDNLASNLCWGTPAENASDRKLHGTERARENGLLGAPKMRKPREEKVGPFRPQARLGDKHPAAKLTSQQVWDIRHAIHTGASTSLLAKFYGVNRTTIQNAVSGRTWGHVA
jgi:hypothetical protein